MKSSGSDKGIHSLITSCALSFELNNPYRRYSAMRNIQPRNGIIIIIPVVLLSQISSFYIMLQGLNFRKF